MPNLLAIRLLPSEAVSSAGSATGPLSEFENYLNGLSIKAFRVSINDLGGTEASSLLGEATWIRPSIPAPTPEPFPVQNAATRIVQHFGFVDPPNPNRELGFFSVATAIFEVPTVAEHETLDVRIEIIRDSDGAGPNPAKVIVHDQVYFNVQQGSLANLANPNQFPSVAAGFYVVLPKPGDEDQGPRISMPPAGFAPKYSELRPKIDAVLTAEPLAGGDIADLTPEECLHIASEIASNQTAYPAPTLPTGTTLNGIYTAPDSDAKRKVRSDFELRLLKYYSERDGEALANAKYVYAIAAAEKCSRISSRKRKVGLEFPIEPGVSSNEFRSVGKVLLFRDDNPRTAQLADDPNTPVDESALPFDESILIEFAVPAPFFYALTHRLPVQIDAQTRFDMTGKTSLEKLVQYLQEAETQKVISSPSGGLESIQAARRLRSLGSADEPSTAECELKGLVQTAVNGWLASKAGLDANGIDSATIWLATDTASTADDADRVAGHLELVLHAITKSYLPLIQFIKSSTGLGISSVADLKLYDTLAKWKAEVFNVEKDEAGWDAIFGPTAEDYEKFFDFLREDPNDTADDIRAKALAGLVVEGKPQQANVVLLPPFTIPGSTDDRIASFVQHLGQFWKVTSTVSFPGAEPTPPAPTLLSKDEVECLGDVDAECVEDLVADLKDPAIPTKDLSKPMKFSVKEAIWARGVHTVERVFETGSESALRDALRGTVAFLHSKAIWDTANAICGPLAIAKFVEQLLDGDNQLSADKREKVVDAIIGIGIFAVAQICKLEKPDLTTELAGTEAEEYLDQIWSLAGCGSLHSCFVPVSLDSNLINCIPPEHVSPLGPVAYLAEMLDVRKDSSCDITTPPSGTMITDAIELRRGKLSGLQVTDANLNVPVPQIDLVNESLENMVGGQKKGGKVYDTPTENIHQHTLNSHPSPADEVRLHDPQQLLEAVPRNSTPTLFRTKIEANNTQQTIVEIGNHKAYDELETLEKVDKTFSSCLLPYSQRLDVSRTYLEAMGSSRFETMRRFQYAITEFVLEPEGKNTPDEFQSHLWRFPVKISIAIEYLRLSQIEFKKFWPVNTEKVVVDDGATQVTWEVPLDEFLDTHCLSYCEFIKFADSSFVAVGPKGFGPKDDLKKVSGIAGKAEEVLNEAGIVSFDDLAEASVAVLEKILSDGGFGAPCDPESWRKQASHLTERDGEAVSGFPDCEPCCLSDFTVSFSETVKGGRERVGLFLRLWRHLHNVQHAKYSFMELSDICEVLNAFLIVEVDDPDNPGSKIKKWVPNHEFIRQLAAFQMLRDMLSLELASKDIHIGTFPITGANRTHLLALWEPMPKNEKEPDPFKDQRSWAIDAILSRIQTYSIESYECTCQPADFLKLLKRNFSEISKLCGLAECQDLPVKPDERLTRNRYKPVWDKHPTHTLRFVEVLCKIYSSDFNVGELLSLFTSAEQSANGVNDRPFGLPDDQDQHSLYALRREICCELDNVKCEPKTWREMTSIMQDVFGMEKETAETPDAVKTWKSIGTHFFPNVLQRECKPAPSDAEQRYSVPLASGHTTEKMWDHEAEGPFIYDAIKGQLHITIPLRDDDVLNRLNRLRRLDKKDEKPELAAVQNLYFKPRADLARFAFIFPGFDSAVTHLIEEPCEETRWEWFQLCFDQFVTKCRGIAKHLARHVACGPGEEEIAVKQVMMLLKHLRADENFSTRGSKSDGNWETDDGMPPSNEDMTWKPRPFGGAFSALLGVCGNGLKAEFTSVEDGSIRWRDITDDSDFFNESRNKYNAPMPTVVPALDLPDDVGAHVAVRNGMGTSSSGKTILGGVEAFKVVFTGSLLIEKAGCYGFAIGGPTELGEKPDFCAIQDDHSWRVKLNRGNAEWILLEHNDDLHNAPADCTLPLDLTSGFYDLTIEITRSRGDFGDPPCPLSTGIQLKYFGPDSCDKWTIIKRKHLFQNKKDASLFGNPDWGVEQVNLTGNDAKTYLQQHYYSTIRDVRRTYERALKALTLVHRYRLSTDKVSDSNTSELGHILGNGEDFHGRSYYQSTGTGKYLKHDAYFDLNFLPVLDNYLEQPHTSDDRAEPTLRREQAMFDWWERMFDHTRMRCETKCAPEPPIWLLYHEAGEDGADLVGDLRDHMSVDETHAEAVCRYADVVASVTAASDGDLLGDFVGRALGWPKADAVEHIVAEFVSIDNVVQLDQTTVLADGQTVTIRLNPLTAKELVDDRWAVRVWQSEKWIRNVLLIVPDADFSAASPAAWASDGPSYRDNAYLMAFYRDGCLENGNIPRYAEVKRLNDGLRERGRTALIEYLIKGKKVNLPHTPNDSASSANGISEQLLQDVEVSFGHHASRIQEAISVVQNFVQRSRIGLEPGFETKSEFAEHWDQTFADFHTWKQCSKRRIYRENWVGFDAIEQASRSESFTLLQSELRRESLSAARPGGIAPWTKPASWSELPALAPSDPLGLVQDRELATLNGARSTTDVGLNLVATPDRHSRWSLLSVAPQKDCQSTAHKLVDGTPLAELPLWIQSAIRMGTDFIRVAAAGLPNALTSLSSKCKESKKTACCSECGNEHRPLIDEYYFWLESSEAFIEPSLDSQKQGGSRDGNLQNADFGRTEDDSTSDWQRQKFLPSLLHWNSSPAVQLRWAKIQNNEILTPRESSESVIVDRGGDAAKPQIAKLEFKGRSGDSLFFLVKNARVSDVSPPQGYAGDDVFESRNVGFRYDIATDTAVVLPNVPDHDENAGDIEKAAESTKFFALHEPGAPLFPTSNYPVALAVGSHLRSRCQFESALKWYESAYSPLSRDNSWIRGLDRDGKSKCKCASGKLDDEEQELNRLILLEYLETMIEWGQSQLRLNTPEAHQKARLLFNTATKILGEKPIHADSTVQVSATVGDKEDGKPKWMECAPINTRLLCLYSSVEDARQTIQHFESSFRRKNRKPNGNFNFFQADLHGGCEDNHECDYSLNSPYRFQVLLQKANEIAGDIKSLGGGLLSAFEKGDGEYLSSIRATHERQVLNLTLDIRKNQWRESDWQVQALYKTLQMAQTRLKYYKELIRVGLITKETDYENETNIAMISNLAGQALDVTAQLLSAAPSSETHVQGPSSGTTVKNDTGNDGSSAKYATVGARIAHAISYYFNTQASLSLTRAGWERREQEWRHQVDVITIEIQQIQRQILAAERRRDIALRELNNHQKQMENSAEVHDFLRDKFTNHALYLWMQQETAALYYQSYELAMDCARQAQRAFNFERGYTRHKFISCNNWDNLHEGLLAGERLQLSLRQMERTYFNENQREYELSKSFSLRHHFPEAFFQLVHCGECEIEIPEWLFDLDYPGQYMRRIKNVTLTLPCVVGPHQGVHCRLTLLSSKTRVSPQVVDPPRGCCDENNNGYTCLPGDSRIVNQYAATDAIATSSGQNDSGMFELRFTDERYLPFEFHGAVSRWRIELPKENNHFDTSTLSDAILQMNFMAREGGQQLAQAARENIKDRTPNSGTLLLDIKRDFPDAWHRFVKGCNSKLELELFPSLFPYSFRSKELEVSSMELFAESDAKSLEWNVDFKSSHPCMQDKKQFDCDRLVVNCVPAIEQCNFLYGATVGHEWRVGSVVDAPQKLILELQSSGSDKGCDEEHSKNCQQIFVMLRYSLKQKINEASPGECC